MPQPRVEVTVGSVRVAVNAITEAVHNNDFERAAALEHALYVEVLKAISHDAPEAATRSIARAALKATKVIDEASDS